MKIAFYKVSNSKDYERHTFDYIYDKPQEILKMLRKLKSDEWIMYDLTQTSRSTMYHTLGDFEEDYNDEMLDGGWWSVIIRDEEPKKVWVVAEHYCKNWGDDLSMVLGVRYTYEDAKKLADERFKQVTTENPDWEIEEDGWMAESPQGFSHGHISIEIEDCEVK